MADLTTILLFPCPDVDLSPSGDSYARPGGGFFYLQPDGSSDYLRP